MDENHTDRVYIEKERRIKKRNHKNKSNRKPDKKPLVNVEYTTKTFTT